MKLRDHWFSGAVALLVFGFLWIPLLVVAANSVNTNALMQSWTGFTTHWYSSGLTTPQ